MLKSSHTVSLHKVFCPILLKEGTEDLKTYGLLFFWVWPRAIHISMVIDDMTIHTFLNALRTFNIHHKRKYLSTKMQPRTKYCFCDERLCRTERTE